VSTTVTDGPSTAAPITASFSAEAANSYAFAFAMVGTGEGWVYTVSIEVHEASDAAQQLRETCHDMRQPVGSVFALVAAALAEPRLPDAARERLKQIAGQAEWLADMIDDFMHNTQPEEAGEADCPDLGDTRDLARRPDVVRIVNEVIAVGHVTWPCELRVISPAGPVQCTLPASLLRRTVSNVLSNAARAAGPSGTVTVEIRRRYKGLIRLAVEDSGPGFGNIPTGASLGLSAVARTIIGAGGRMECGCGSRGGARVCLWLP
jgi:K+-sensing histidine kinase KdpD